MIEVSLFLHEQTYKKISFLQSRTNSFKAWICPLLKPALYLDTQYIYLDEDDISHIYFVKSGNCGFVLPKHANAKYIDINVGAHFGIIDIVASVLKHKDGLEMLNDWVSHREILKRQFTCAAGNKHCELLQLSIFDLTRMKNEFLEAHESLFNDAYQRLYRTLRVKLKAMKLCQQVLGQEV